MKFLDTSSSLRIAILLEMLEDVTRATDPEEAVRAYAGKIRKVRPAEAMVGVSLRGLGPGQYRVTRLFCTDRKSSGYIDKSPKPIALKAGGEELPVHTGGFIGALMARKEPSVVQNLAIGADPVLGDLVSQMGSALAVPVFEAGRVTHWMFLLRSSPTGYSVEDLEEDLLIGNLFSVLTRNLEAINQIGALNEVLHRQFEEVARVQRALLPSAMPDVPGLSFAASYLTSGQAGGDSYDFFTLPEGKVGVLIADVSGHGPASATVMAMLHAILHASREMVRGPAAALKFANDQLARTAISGTHVTAIFCEIDSKTRRLTIARAGHPLPRVRSVGGRVERGSVRELTVPAAAPMGILGAGYEIQEHAFTLAPGECVILHTDGITECVNPEGEQLGVAGLDEAILDGESEPSAMIERVLRRVKEHTGANVRLDDQTVVVVRVDGE